MIFQVRPFVESKFLVLETRLLDFDTVIMTDVNEGVLPAGKKQQSFLPFEVKEYELPTFLDQDAIYTITFIDCCIVLPAVIYYATAQHQDYKQENLVAFGSIGIVAASTSQNRAQVLYNNSNLKLSIQEFPKTSGWYNAYQHGPKGHFAFSINYLFEGSFAVL